MRFFPKGALLAIVALGTTSLGLAHGVQAMLVAKVDQSPQCSSVDACGVSLTSLTTP